MEKVLNKKEVEKLKKNKIKVETEPMASDRKVRGYLLHSLSSRFKEVCEKVKKDHKLSEKEKNFLEWLKEVIETREEATLKGKTYLGRMEDRGKVAKIYTNPTDLLTLRHELVHALLLRVDKEVSTNEFLSYAISNMLSKNKEEVAKVKKEDNLVRTAHIIAKNIGVRVAEQEEERAIELLKELDRLYREKLKELKGIEDLRKRVINAHLRVEWDFLHKHKELFSKEEWKEMINALKK